VRYSEKLIYIYRLAICRLCGFKIDRNSVGAMNIWLRAFEAYVEGAWVVSKNLRDEE
jgi:transposase